MLEVDLNITIIILAVFNFSFVFGLMLSMSNLKYFYSWQYFNILFSLEWKRYNLQDVINFQTPTTSIYKPCTYSHKIVENELNQISLKWCRYELKIYRKNGCDKSCDSSFYEKGQSS